MVTTLDVTMPGMDGFATARRIREFSSTYILMITGMAEEIDVVDGLTVGADDYLVKRFRPRELRARIEAVLRRPRLRPDDRAVTPSGPATANFGPYALSHDGLRLDPATRNVTVDDEPVSLTRSEFDLMQTLMAAGRRVRSKADLVVALRGEDDVVAPYVNDADKRALEVHMANLRRKLGDNAAAPRFIETVRGVGYRMAAGN